MQLLQATSSSVGSKILIALTGLAMAIFLVGHLAGNLLFLVGPEAFNHYAHSLTSNPLVYVAEAGLIAVFLLHIGKTLAGYLANRAARPERYAKKQWARAKSDRSRKSLSSTTMIVTGTITALFVVTHLLTFKFGAHYVAVDGVRDLYRLQLEVFSQPLYVLFYVVAMFIIFSHLWHGLSSAAQSMGIDHKQWTPRIILAGRLLSLVIAGGFLIIPIFTFLLSRSAR